jgi:hypothetical protein
VNTVRIWNSRRENDIIAAERWSRRNAPKEMPRRSAGKLRYGPVKSGIRLISERFAARRPANEIDGTLNVTQKTFTAI